MKIGDIIKLNRHDIGIYGKYQVLGPDDQITDNCICAMGSPSGIYSKTLAMYNNGDLSEVIFVKSKLIGEYVKDHQNRLYLKYIEPIRKSNAIKKSKSRRKRRR